MTLQPWGNKTREQSTIGHLEGYIIKKACGAELHSLSLTQQIYQDDAKN